MPWRRLEWACDCYSESVISRRKLELCLFGAGVAVSRFAFRSHDLYDLDSVNFALGIDRFDPRLHQPHPPGYFLYVYFGRVLNFFTHDANLALVLMSVLASVFSVLLIYALACEWFGPLAASFAGMLFLFSPLEWFHGTVALTYSVEGAASSLIGLLCWRIDRGKNNMVIPAAIALGITAGVRPSSILFLGPLFLYSLRSVSWKHRFLGAAILGVTIAAWFVPMIWASGGFGAYFGALESLWRMVPSKGTIFNSSPVNSVARGLTIIFIYFLCFGAASLAPFGASLSPTRADNTKKVFTAVWVLPALFFFTFIFLKLVNSGYVLLVAAPGCVWLGAGIADWYRHCSWRKSFKWAVFATIAVINVAIFLAFPAYCSFASVRHFEKELQATQDELPQVGNPGTLLIVSFDNHLLGFRHAGYYFPDYLTLEYPEADLVEGKRIFAMQNRNTLLLSGLPSNAPARFVLFPLPAGQPEYTKYLETVEKMLPADDLSSVRVGGHEYVTAPTADLRFLFPAAAQSPALIQPPPVYTPRSTDSVHP